MDREGVRRRVYRQQARPQPWSIPACTARTGVPVRDPAKPRRRSEQDDGCQDTQQHERDHRGANEGNDLVVGVLARGLPIRRRPRTRTKRVCCHHKLLTCTIKPSPSEICHTVCCDADHRPCFARRKIGPGRGSAIESGRSGCPPPRSPEPDHFAQTAFEGVDHARM